MRIVHLATFESGGAARSAQRLHRGLLNSGHHSAMLVRERVSKDPSVFRADFEPMGESKERCLSFDGLQKWHIDQNRTPVSNTFFSLNEPGLDVTGHPLVAQADVIHLHWVARFLSPGSLQQLVASGKPVFWTLHDQRAFTGGCHFSAGCVRFWDDCSQCPQLEWNPLDLTRAQLADQKQMVPARDITLVCPSRWLAQLAGQSALFRRTRTEFIPYSIDTELFAPMPKRDARQKLGVDHEQIHLLFGADNGNEKRKGFDLLIAAIQRCLREPGFKKRVEQRQIALLCLGHPNAQIESLGIPFVPFGYLKSDEKVNLLYNAADLFILPSLEDNSPNTVMESMSCGTPVVAFAAGGIPEIVRDGATGLLAPVGDVEKLAAAICRMVENGADRIKMGEEARRQIAESHALASQAQQYLRLYGEILASRSLQPSGAPFQNIPETFSTSLAASPGAGVAAICAESMPKPLRKFFAANESQVQRLQKEHAVSVATMEDQTETVKRLEAAVKEQYAMILQQDAAIKAFEKTMRRKPVKLLKKLKVI